MVSTYHFALGELKGRPALTFWIAYGEKLDFLKKYNEICNMGSVEDQKRTYPKFTAEGFRRANLKKILSLEL